MIFQLRFSYSYDLSVKFLLALPLAFDWQVFVPPAESGRFIDEPSLDANLKHFNFVLQNQIALKKKVIKI